MGSSRVEVGAGNIRRTIPPSPRPTHPSVSLRGIIVVQGIDLAISTLEPGNTSGCSISVAFPTLFEGSEGSVHRCTSETNFVFFQYSRLDVA